MSSACNALKTALSKQGVASIPQDCCQIAGVTCASDNTTIVELAIGRFDGFPYNSTTNTFDDISQVTTLKRLSATDIYVNGGIPVALARLQNLESLKLSKCNFSGRVPEELTQLVNLKILHLSTNFLQGPLPDLDIGGNQFSQDLPNWLWKMTKLSDLLAASTGFTGQLPDDISNLSGLVGLDLESNMLTGQIPTAMCNLKNLKYLDLSHNQFIGSLPIQVGQLKYLYYLDVSNNNLTGQVPATLNNLTFTESYGSTCSVAKNMFACRESDLDPYNACAAGLEKLPYCPGASSFLPPAAVSAGPTASGDAPASPTSSVSPAVYACLPVLFLVGATVAWFAAKKRYHTQAAVTYAKPSVQAPQARHYSMELETPTAMEHPPTDMLILPSEPDNAGRHADQESYDKA
ncbi:hypothetical protein RI367_007478 [Sorochytrium milnesiophthora]